MTIKFYSDELAWETGGKIKYDTLDFDPGKYKTCAGAAKALYKALCKRAKAEGMDPDVEVKIYTPKETLEWGMGYACWRVVWEAGPFEWAIGASFAITGPWGYTEPHYSFDLCFVEA